MSHGPPRAQAAGQHADTLDGLKTALSGGSGAQPDAKRPKLDGDAGAAAAAAAAASVAELGGAWGGAQRSTRECDPGPGAA